jgi:hypothetical protein
MEDKEKYEIALSNMRKFRDALKNHEETDLWVPRKDIVRDIEYYFPELKESKDEKIRKDIRQCIKLCSFVPSFVPSNGTSKDEMFAWLEKQGEQKQQDKEYTFKSIPRLLDMIEPSEKAKFYCQKLIDTLTKEGYNTDVKIVDECLKRMNGEKVGMATMDEKKQSPKFNEGDILYSPQYRCIWIYKDNKTFYAGISLNNPDNLVIDSSIEITSDVILADKDKRDLLLNKIKDKGYVFDFEKNELKKKIKYKAGDWIVSKYGDLFQVKEIVAGNEIVAGDYKLLCPSGNEEINSVRIVDNNSHLWSIKDAKDGDVLCVYDNIFIFKEHINWEYKVYSYCELHNGEKLASIHPACICSGEEETLKPATKEQRDLLFEKIAEAGYKWDAEKKVLNKIKMQDLVTSENNVTKISDQDKWDNEDIRMLNTVINIFEKVYPSNYFTTFVTGSENPTLINSPEIVKWLKGIKQKALGKLKLTKKDLEALRIAIINLGDMAEVDAICNFNMTFGEAKEKLIEIKDRYSE